jgi:hypothetical protein
MSNYVKSTNFAAKDNLPKGDPLKVVKGTELDVEFNAIATSIVSKANNVSPSFTGTPFAPTAALGTNTNQIATTAFVAANQTPLATILNTVYPIGSVYTNATNSTNPATLLGFGTWVAFGAGRVMVGFNGADPLFDSAEETGGSKDAIVVSHSHGVTDPGHAHTYVNGAPSPGYFVDGNTGPQGYLGTSATTSPATTGISIQTAGSSGTNANLQPYITVYLWKRTA